MTIQDAIQVLEDRLARGDKTQISIEFTINADGVPVIDYHAVYGRDTLDMTSNIDLETVEAALIDIAERLRNAE